MTNKVLDTINAVVDLDGVVQQLLRNSWPEAWLQINLPLG